MICGTYGTTHAHLEFIDKVLGLRPGANVYAGMNFVITEERQLAMVDTHVNENPTAAELAEITIMLALVREPALRARCITAGRARAAQLTWTTTARETAAVYRSLI